MSRRNKDRSQLGSSADYRSKCTPPVFFPAVIGVPEEEFEFTDIQIAQLETAGQVKFPEKQRSELVTLAEFWIGDLRLRRTARPKQFRGCLEKMAEIFSKAEQTCRLNEIGGSLESHLLHWAMETPAPGAAMFPFKLAALERDIQIVRETVIGLLQCLPPDPGRQRPFDDERRLMYLADIFEKVGGKAVAYASSYSETSSMADTPFRRFAQRFYSILPAEDKRDPGGLDDALRDALAARRAQASPSP
jgi:hypothetical protein